MKKISAVLLAITFASSSVAVPAKKPAEKSTKPPEDTRIVEAKQRLREQMTDPESTNFRGVYLGTNGVVCGQVNSKNRMGGYAGFQRFFVTANQIRIETHDLAAFDYRWLEYCEENSPQ